MGVAVSDLTKLVDAMPVPLVFDFPALTPKPQQRFRAGAQGGDEQVHVVKRLAVTPACAHQLDDPAGFSPALTDGACGIADTESPANLAPWLASTSFITTGKCRFPPSARKVVTPVN